MVINEKGMYMDEHNQVLNFCRETPQRKFNIEMELGIPSNRLGTILTTLRLRELIDVSTTPDSSKVFQYKTKPDAVYTILPRIYVKQQQKRETDNKGIVIKGNVTTVSSASYHTKGHTPKRSVWIGSSADM